MANYRCTAACRHCLYASSPTREGGYITEDCAQKVAMLLKKGGCRSVHIGGGEPFLDFEGLITLINSLGDQGIFVDYIETNGYFAKNEEKVKGYIKRLLEVGVDSLCISLDPFHGEYVPPALPLRLSALCEKYGMGSFLWKRQYVKELSVLDMNRHHSREDLSAVLDKNYIAKTANSYGIKFGGRAVNIEEEYANKKPVYELLNAQPCHSLTSTDHFHIDMHMNYVPPGCTGFVIPLIEMVNGLEENKYPVFEALLKGGIKALYEFAIDNGIQCSEKGYTSSCNLCFHLRESLSKTGKYKELLSEHYTASRMYY